MDEPAFRELILEYLVPMLSGTQIGNEEQSLPGHALVAYDGPCALLIKPAAEAPYRLPFSRSQPFASDEKRLVELFIGELSGLVAQFGSAYFRDLMASVPRRVISQLLPGARGRTALEAALQRFEALASQTYEGRPVVAALGLTGTMGHGLVRMKELWKEDLSAVLSNGFDVPLWE